MTSFRIMMNEKPCTAVRVPCHNCEAGQWVWLDDQGEWVNAAMRCKTCSGCGVWHPICGDCASLPLGGECIVCRIDKDELPHLEGPFVQWSGRTYRPNPETGVLEGPVD